MLRLEELSAKNITNISDVESLVSFGTTESVPEWYYDPATNSLFNGGSSETNTPVSNIKKEKMKDILIKGLSESFL